MTVSYFFLAINAILVLLFFVLTALESDPERLELETPPFAALHNLY